MVRIGDTIYGKNEKNPCKWAIYERRRGDESTFEVVRLRQSASDKRINGRVIAEAGSEYYPSASKWGIDGFSYRTRAEANAAFDMLTSVD